MIQCTETDSRLGHDCKIYFLIRKVSKILKYDEKKEKNVVLIKFIYYIKQFYKYYHTIKYYFAKCINKRF